MPESKLHFQRRSPEYPPPRSFSAVLREIAANATGDVSIDTIRVALADRSFAALIMFFALINMVPLPLGTSVVLGIPLLLLSQQMARGLPAPWLPRFIRDRSLSRATFLKIETKLTPWIEWVEKFIKPRRWPFDRRSGEVIMGVLIAFLSVLLIIPIPFGNWPPAFAIFLCALALSERDGIMLIVSLVASAVATALFIGSAALIIFVSKEAINSVAIALPFLVG